MTLEGLCPILLDEHQLVDYRPYTFCQADNSWAKWAALPSGYRGARREPSTLPPTRVCVFHPQKPWIRLAFCVAVLCRLAAPSLSVGQLPLYINSMNPILCK
nr:hypothetical protein Itr_chr14CG28750 [Ipomoea trifida]